MSENTLTLSDGEFENMVLKSPELFLVDFWAEWCAPCRALSRVVDEVAKDHVGRVRVGKLNIDENPSTPSKYGVRAIPTLILFKNGEVVDQVVGLVAKNKLDELIAKHSA